MIRNQTGMPNRLELIAVQWSHCAPPFHMDKGCACAGSEQCFIFCCMCQCLLQNRNRLLPVKN
jgi:hypothetical protein